MTTTALPATTMPLAPRHRPRAEPAGSLLEQARALAPQFSARAREAEALATLPGDLVATAKAAGLCLLASVA